VSETNQFHRLVIPDGGFKTIIVDQELHVEASIRSPDGPLKFDEGKLDLALVECWVEEELCKVYTIGLKKYHKGSWKKFDLEQARELVSPAKRHLNAYRKGEYYDPETGLPHLVQAAWNLLTIHYHETKGTNNE
jgi:hypothetical protein